jgi:hypothetical protein
MIKFLISIIILLFSHIAFPQNFDVRKTIWGMSAKEVLNSESPLTPYNQFDTSYQSTFTVNYIILFKNIIIGNYQSDIRYLFSNGKLVEVEYNILDNDNNEQGLFAKVLKTSFIYNFLTKEKSMEKLYCWSYDNASYKVFSGKTDCDFASKETVDNVEKTGKTINYVNKAIYALKNERTNASLEFNIKDGLFKKTLVWIHFTPSSVVNDQLKVNDF